MEQLPKCTSQNISQTEMITHRDAQIHLVVADCQRNIQQEKQRLLCGTNARRKNRSKKVEDPNREIDGHCYNNERKVARGAMVYLDNASTTKINNEILEVMLPYMTDEFGNAGSIHALGRKAASAINKAREQVANLLECDVENIIFTSGGSEANNLVFSGLQDYLTKSNRTHIVTTAVEHDSVIKSIENICTKFAFGATFLCVNNRCKLDIDSLKEELLDSKVGLVSAMYVNNETGSVNDVKQIAKVAHKSGALFHTDCVQAAGHKAIHVDKIGCDFMSISSHKIGGPKGVGALYVKDKSLLTPSIFGGREQEYGLRGGTENVAGIVGFGKACEITKMFLRSSQRQLRDINDLFLGQLRLELKRLGLCHILHVNGEVNGGNILNLRFDNVDGETLVLALDAKQVYVSAGSACRSHESEPSRVLLGMGLTPDQARDSIRVSFAPTQNYGAIVFSAKTIAYCVKSLHFGG